MEQINNIVDFFKGITEQQIIDIGIALVIVASICHIKPGNFISNY